MKFILDSMRFKSLTLAWASRILVLHFVLSSRLRLSIIRHQRLSCSILKVYQQNLLRLSRDRTIDDKFIHTLNKSELNLPFQQIKFFLSPLLRFGDFNYPFIFQGLTIHKLILLPPNFLFYKNIYVNFQFEFYFI